MNFVIIPGLFHNISRPFHTIIVIAATIYFLYNVEILQHPYIYCHHCVIKSPEARNQKDMSRFRKRVECFLNASPRARGLATAQKYISQIIQTKIRKNGGGFVLFAGPWGLADYA